MATYDELMQAARQAHEAGNTDHARRFLELAREQRATPSAMRSRIDAAKAGTLEVSPERAQAAQEADQKAMDQAILADVGSAGALATKVVQGLPFVGEWVDEGFGLIDPERRDNLREIQGAMQREKPTQSTVAQIGGGILGALATGRAGAGAVGWTQAAPSLAGKAIRGAGLGLGSGAIEGALQGAGAANDGDRMEGAKTGAAIGGGLGFALGGAAPFAAEGISNLLARAKKLDVSTIADEFGISMPAARSVKQALANDNLDEATRLLSRGGDDAMLADAGVSAGALLDASSQTGGAALSNTQRAVNARAGDAGGRLRRVLDDVLGAPDGVRSGARDIASRTSAARKAAYDAAYSRPINYADDTGRAIEGVLARVPARTLRTAIDEANDAMQAAGTRNRQIMADIADDGTVVFREMPNVQQLDEIKKALGSAGQEINPQTMRPTPAAMRAKALARDLRRAIGEAVPEYNRAVQLGGDSIAESNAYRVGTKIFNPSTTLEDVRDVMSDSSMEARQAARRGMRENIENIMANVQRTISDPNVDAREAMAIIKRMSSREGRAKARLILGPDADQLFSELDRATAALELQARTARNSATAVRGAIQDQVSAEAQPGFLRRVIGKGGNPLDAASEVSSTVMGIDPRTISEREKAIFDEIANVLTSMRGEQAQKALATVRAAIEGQQMKQVDADVIGRLVAAHLANAGYQTGTQAPQLAP